MATIKPCNKLKYELIKGIVFKGSNENPKNIKENIVQNIHARTTVVNLGVSGFQRIVTVYNAKPVADTKPNKAPRIVPVIESLMIIMQTPKKAINIEIKVERLKISPKIKKPNTAAIKGIAANIKSVTAAEVIVIE